MLTAEQIDALADPIVDLYDEFAQTVINDIARRLTKMSIASAAWQTQRIIESGKTYEFVLRELAKITGIREDELKKIFRKAGVTSAKFDNNIYRLAGLPVPPLNLSPAMVKVLLSGLDKTKGVLDNLTLTTAVNAQREFIRAADLTYLQVTTGAMSYQQAIRLAIKKLGSSGLYIYYPSGHKDRLDVAIRRTLITGVGQTVGKMQMTLAEEVGQDLVQVSAHIGARNEGEGYKNHEDWQGKVYSRSGKHPKYKNFYEATGYGEKLGLMGINCRHTFFPFFDGISQNAYDAATLKQYAKQKVKYNGETMGIYEATQRQRAIERTIRKHKREAEALKAAGFDATPEALKVKQAQSLMRDFIKQTGLQRQRFRETIFPNPSGTIAPPTPKPTDPPVITPSPAPLTQSKPKLTQVEKPKIENAGNDLSVQVSQALDLSQITNKAIKDEVEIAIKSIDKVHSDGVLPKIPILGTGAGKSYGKFWYDYSNNPIKIAISKNGDHKALTTLHEVGHFLDSSGIKPRWSSSSQSGFNRIVFSAKKSNWWSGFYKRVDDFSSALDRRFSFSHKYLNYIRNDKEILARAYAQFIAIESGDPILLAQLRAMQAETFPVQWTDEDFAPIADEFRRLFIEQGWMK